MLSDRQINALARMSVEPDFSRRVQELADTIRAGGAVLGENDDAIAARLWAADDEAAKPENVEAVHQRAQALRQASGR